MRGNETCSRGARGIKMMAVAAIAAGSLAASMAGAVTAARAADAPKAPAASQKQAIGRLKGAWWIARGIRDNLWSDFDPNGIPVLYVERRAGQTSFALLTGIASPPADFTRVMEPTANQPAIYLSSKVVLPAGAGSPFSFAGKSTALYVAGETLADPADGASPAEKVIPQIIHEMAHVYAASKGMPADMNPAPAPAATLSPELLALTAIENRALADFLFSDAGKTMVLEDLARQFLAIRRARWAMLGKSSDFERRVELFEAPAFFAQSAAMRLTAQKVLEPPPIQDVDPSYHSFQYGLLWRLELLVGRLVDTPVNAGHLALRVPIAGAAQVMMLDRLGVEWKEKVFKGEGSLADLLGARLTMDPTQQEAALTAARASYGYDAALALAKESLFQGR
ncbi:MAG: hypothetical protein HY049_01670 [Acidobacteria bacterium]|nr:hypothetical protein [Acidobacteriota bacterium]